MKYTLSTRYAFGQSDWGPYVQAVYAHTGKSYNDLFVADRLEQKSYGLLDATIGIQRNSWTLELFGNNLTNENAEVFKYFRGGDTRVTANRPMSWGVRFWQRF